jgi:hypothetical protein
VVRFALSNKGDKVLYLASIRLVFRPGSRLFGARLVLDPAEDRVLPLELAEGVANVLRQRNLPVELVPGDSVGYRFGADPAGEHTEEGRPYGGRSARPGGDRQAGQRLPQTLRGRYRTLGLYQG